MPLDDFFAKKEKKKSKKKQNPQELIEKLTKEVEKLKEDDGAANVDVMKSGVNLGDDEWEAIEEEEKDIEVQNVRMGNLELAPVEDSTKQAAKEQGDKEVTEEPDDSKKVWASKVAAPKEEEEVEEEKPQPPPETEGSKRYIPVHLRQGYTSALAPPKPNVSSATDFPSLDAAVSAEPAGKTKTPETKPHEEDDNVGWSQAGVPQRQPRTQETQSVTAHTNPSVYVPPSLRSSGFHSAAPTGRLESRQEFRSSRPRESMTNRSDGPIAGQRFEGFQPRENTGFGGDDWRRGATISSSKPFNAGPSGGTPFSTKVPSPSRPSFGSVKYGTESNSGWTHNVNIKTFRETGRDKPEFELVQTNRFAGLEES